MPIWTTVIVLVPTMTAKSGSLLLNEIRLSYPCLIFTVTMRVTGMATTEQLRCCNFLPSANYGPIQNNFRFKGKKGSVRFMAPFITSATQFEVNPPCLDPTGLSRNCHIRLSVF